MQHSCNTALANKSLAAPGITLGLLLAAVFAGNASAATLSVGPGKTYAKPCAAIAAAADGDTIEITGNTTYSGDVCGIYRNNLTIRGVNGRPRIDAAGAASMGKGTWVVVGNNLTVDNVEMLGARVPDANGAAFRVEGTNFTLRNSYIHDNEDGILAGANTNSDFLIEYTEFSHNGHGDGYSHNLYIGNVKSLTFRYNYSHDANIGHNLKSRAITNTILYNRFSSSGLGSPSYEIDLPNAGTTYIIGNVIEQPSNNSNPAMIAYGEEGLYNGAQNLYVVNNTFLNDDASRGTFVMVGSAITTPVLLQNNIFAGTGTVTYQANAIDRTNYRSLAPAFVDRAAYDLHPTGAQMINTGSAPGTSVTGVSLTPVAQYKHVASGEARPVSGQIDIGAYEAVSSTTSSTTTTTAPAPTTTTSPTTGTTSTTTTGTTTTSTSGWTWCATEGGTCTFSGTRQVRYGANGYYYYKTATGSIGCNNSVFGDPANGVVKACSYANTTTSGTTTVSTTSTTSTSTTTTTTTSGWTACATEGGICSFSGTRQVRYGANGYYYYKTATSSIACNNSVFGDPANKVVKACYYAN
jgi:hypothetical protein